MNHLKIPSELYESCLTSRKYIYEALVLIADKDAFYLYGIQSLRETCYC